MFSEAVCFLVRGCYLKKLRTGIRSYIIVLSLTDISNYKMLTYIENPSNVNIILNNLVKAKEVLIIILERKYLIQVLN